MSDTKESEFIDLSKKDESDVTYLKKIGKIENHLNKFTL